MGTNHAHVEAAFLTIVLLLIVYAMDWVIGWKIPALLFGLPSFLVLFGGTYVVLYLVLRIGWSSR